MTIQKARKLVDWLLENDKKLRNDLLDPEKSWNKGKPDMIGELAGEFARIFERDCKVLQVIRKELGVKCKHPKKMRDKANGIWYCMNCNQDL